MPENEDAETVYYAVQDQYVMGFDGYPIALNTVAIHKAIDMYEVDNKIDCFEKVMKAGAYFINRKREKLMEGR